MSIFGSYDQAIAILSAFLKDVDSWHEHETLGGRLREQEARVSVLTQALELLESARDAEEKKYEDEYKHEINKTLN